MSAREELISLLRTTMDEKDATEVADAYAHELAEKLKARAQRAPDPYGRYHSFKEVARVLIAEIDPEFGEVGA